LHSAWFEIISQPCLFLLNQSFESTGSGGPSVEMCCRQRQHLSQMPRLSSVDWITNPDWNVACFCVHRLFPQDIFVAKTQTTHYELCGTLAFFTRRRGRAVSLIKNKFTVVPCSLFNPSSESINSRNFTMEHPSESTASAVFSSCRQRLPHGDLHALLVVKVFWLVRAW
jgi:hypothetical protein